MQKTYEKGFNYVKDIVIKKFKKGNFEYKKKILVIENKVWVNLT